MGLLAGVTQTLLITGVWMKYNIISLKKDNLRQWLSISAIGILTVVLVVLLSCQNYRIHTFINISVVYTIVTILAGIDLKRKIIPNLILGVGFGVRSVLLLYECFFSPETIQASFLTAVLGFLFGLFFLLLLSFITKHGIGYGDVKMFAWLGFCMGLSDTYNILFYSVLAAAVAGVYLLLVKKAERKQELPFAPFVYIGCYLVFGMTFLQGLG